MAYDKDELLLPADIDDILVTYGYLLKSYKHLYNRNSIFANFRRTNKRLEVLFPLIEHPVLGITGLHAVENYNEKGYIRLYQYNWKIIIPKKSIQLSHISGWGNDPHNAEWTPDEFKIETEPHHHHYDPHDRTKRRANYDVRSLEQAFNFIKKYIETGKEYNPHDIY
ncbi:hypothetical protein KFZ58_02035 [Virgibacillus sp. NKC19-16]|uniref:toxin-antitoxin system TumE family protein n=1 Tax=Virgibacillus salidurans TaxID=2831673 RepID=UPI001F299B3E|nr:DUF6516 family protein [Virgibacillus sp. NKC19-16]UJL46758.1 hypothetical protein KFZ58_02035 [Virgibacillus sp. NKC19-16]